jgi:hypothetical protein
VSERDDLLNRMREIFDDWVPACNDLALRELRALFAEKPWLANELLPEGSMVCRWEHDPKRDRSAFRRCTP